MNMWTGSEGIANIYGDEELVVIRRGPGKTTRPDLVQDLEDALNKPDRQGEPTIIEESGRGTNRFSVTVIWAKWQEVPLDERGAIVMEAYQNARKDWLDINAVLALTASEANDLQIDIEGVG